MRVLYVDNSRGMMGGSLVSLLQLSRALVEQSRSVPAAERIEPCFYFLYPNLFDGEFRDIGEVVLEREDYTDFGIPEGLPKALGRILSTWPSRIQKALGEVLPLALRVAHHARRMKVDMIHTNCRLGSNEYAILGGLLAGIPVLCHERLVYKLTPLTKVFAKAAGHVIAVSRAVADNLEKQGVSPHRLSVLYNGINTSELARYRGGEKAPNSPFRIGLVGRITYDKGQHILVEAARRLIAQGLDAEFHFAGESLPSETEYLEALLATVQDAELEARVVFHGNVKTIYEFMSNMDILVHCSLKPFGLDRVIQEAMALGKPLIATRGGAVEEICEDGVNALVVDPGRPDLLAESIARLLREPQMARHLARNALSTIETRFSLARAATGVRAIYKEVHARAARRPIVDAFLDLLSNNPLSRRRVKASHRRLGD